MQAFSFFFYWPDNVNHPTTIAGWPQPSHSGLVHFLNMKQIRTSGATIFYVLWICRLSRQQTLVAGQQLNQIEALKTNASTWMALSWYARKTCCWTLTAFHHARKCILSVYCHGATVRIHFQSRLSKWGKPQKKIADFREPYFFKENILGYLEWIVCKSSGIALDPQTLIQNQTVSFRKSKNQSPSIIKWH